MGHWLLFASFLVRAAVLSIACLKNPRYHGQRGREEKRAQTTAQKINPFLRCLWLAKQPQFIYNWMLGRIDPDEG